MGLWEPFHLKRPLVNNRLLIKTVTFINWHDGSRQLSTAPEDGSALFYNSTVHIKVSWYIYHHKFPKWYRNAVVTKQPSEHNYLSHATFPFPRHRFLRQAVVYSIFLAFWVNICSVRLTFFPQATLYIDEHNKWLRKWLNTSANKLGLRSTKMSIYVLHLCF
jgi:hypothetical protein